MSKSYVVFVGKKTGIFDTWEECKEYVNGFKGAIYKSFKTIEEAEEAFENYFNETSLPLEKNVKTINDDKNNSNFTTAITIDGACAGNPGVGEYQGVKISGDLENMIIKEKEECIKSKIYPKTTNNIMEFLALVEAIKYVFNTKNYTVKILTDSITALAWVRNKKVKTSLIEEEINKDMFIEIKESLKFLKGNDLSKIIIEKWDTNKYGEIPADFGRK